MKIVREITIWGVYWKSSMKKKNGVGKLYALIYATGFAKETQILTLATFRTKET